MSGASGTPSLINTITMNGSTQGGIIGGVIEFVGIAATGVAQNDWLVSGVLNTTGIPVTIFS